jgi:DNA polymerase (family X)
LDFFAVLCAFASWREIGSRKGAKSQRIAKIGYRKMIVNQSPGTRFTIYGSRFTIHQPMTNEQIARRFNRMASLMEVRGEDSFRIRSYRMAAEAIETWPTPMKEIAAEGGGAGLQEIPGVGKAIAGKIVELLEKGTFDAWDRLTAETPETVLDLLELPGVGPKTAATFHQKFKIASLEDLRKFIDGGGLEMVDGIGPKTAERIKQNLERIG